MDSRDYILKRLSSRRMSIDEFNFEKLDAPPLNMFLSQYDIAELYKIATSLKLQAKPEVRYKMIDDIMKRRGMEKFGSGTNRVIYKHPEFQDILFKVAADNIGLRDNPNEYRNQFLVKPFVTKTFEISPCGTVALVEKVNPIRSREEFISVADDIFEAITEFFVGKYVLADIGEQFFMNWGVREGFGPVLLDYPYIYELDGEKLYCCREDPSSEIGMCGGLIDYDNGFNKLVCSKCGAIYKAAELKKNIENKIISKGGKREMKITINGRKGTRVIGENTTPFAPQQDAVPVYSSINVTATGRKNTVNKIENTEEKPVATVKEQPKQQKKEFKKYPEKTVNGVVDTDTKDVTDPIAVDEAFGEECKKKAAEEKNKKPPVERADELIAELLEVIDSISVDIAKKDTMIRCINKLVKELPKEDVIKSSAITDAIGDFDINITNIDRSNNNLDVTVEVTTDIEDYGTSEVITIENVFDEEDDEQQDQEDEVVDEAPESTTKYNGVTYRSGYVKDISTIFTNYDSKDVILLSDDGGQRFITDKDGYLIAIDTIDDRDVNKTKFVSKKWFDTISAEQEEETVKVEV